MSKTISTMILSLMIATIAFYSPSSESEQTNANEVYPRAMEIIAFEEEHDTVVLEDAVGLSWCFYGIEDWEIGDMVIVMLDNNGTPDTITDDIIVDTYFSGYTNPFSAFNNKVL